MIIANILATVLFATATGCVPDTATPASPASDAREAATASSTQLTGFVELYSEGDVLLSGGREIALAGPAHLLEPMGGLEVQVKGRFIERGVFLVESISPTSSKVIARSANDAAARSNTTRSTQK